METRKIRVFGVVQGVGFRPFIKRLADEMSLCGSVCNRGSFVEIKVNVGSEALRILRKRIMDEAPRPALIYRMEDSRIADEAFEGFRIIESLENRGERFIPADIAICDECAAELFDPKNRRYLHPFINCTNCGPRLSVIERLPYDRFRTSMDKFELCSECEREYRDIYDRRYDAQPVCCNKCGPGLYAYRTDNPGKKLSGNPVTEARRVIVKGGVVAVKGIGGFHLCCDATDTAVVDRLRKRKNRPVKPFAVMGRDMEAIKKICYINKEQEKLLADPGRPIAILTRITSEGEGIPSMLCAPDNPTLGVFLPYAPVQLLLFGYPDDIEGMPDYLVMTSGNVSGAPIAIDDRQANEMLSSFCDLVLSNNRDILCRADDSVISCYGGRNTFIRRSRGYAPLPIEAPSAEGCVLAIGGEMKSTFCIAKDGLYYPSTFIGEQSDIRSELALRGTIDHYLTALSLKPEVVVCDSHPAYISSMIAGEVAREYGVGLVKLQHHYAHILSCMAENGLDERVIGIALDGTGYGDDGGIWGGELLVCDRSSYERKASHAPFSQAGGDASAKQGWRIAAGMLCDRFADDPGEAEAPLIKLGICDHEEFEAVKLLSGGIRSTSCGRLFDAVAAVLGICRENSFEGEAAMKLQFAAQRAMAENLGESEDGYTLTIELADKILSKEMSGIGHMFREEEGRLILPTDTLFYSIVDSCNKGIDVEKSALDFHIILAVLWKEAVRKVSEAEGIQKVALSGGCFVNPLLTGFITGLLEQEGFMVYTQRAVPSNDGGLALGQAFYKVKEGK